MAFRKGLKKGARRFAKKVGVMAKKRYVKKGGPNVRNIYKDVMMLKGLVNAEKKRLDVAITTPASFGATAGAGVTGLFAQNITPLIAQGVTGSTRNGLSVKLVSGCLDLQFAQSVNTVNQVRIRYFLVCRPDNANGATASSISQMLLEPNPFSTVIDYHSSRDPENFKNLRVIKQGYTTLIPDQLTGQITYKQLKIPLKFNHHLKFQTDGTTSSQVNNFYLIVTADLGDAIALTGGNVLYNMRWYFTDN